MRSIPGMVVMSPADDVEAKAHGEGRLYEHVGPVYMRFGRAGVPVFHDEENFQFQIGKGEVLTEGTDVAIIANGLLVAEAPGGRQDPEGGGHLRPGHQHGPPSSPWTRSWC